MLFFFFFQAEAGIRDLPVTGVQPCALPISLYLPSAGLLLAASAALSRLSPERMRLVVAMLCLLGGVRTALRDRKSVVQGKSVDLGGRRIIKKKKRNMHQDTTPQDHGQHTTN